MASPAVKRKRTQLASVKEFEADATARKLEPVRAWLTQHIEDKSVQAKALAQFTAQLVAFGIDTLGPGAG